MIVFRDNGRLRCITQNDHAALAAEILALWRHDGLPDCPRRDALLRATREHDNGWQEIDAAPLVDRSTGAPHDFRSVPGAERLDLWERGACRHLEDDPYVALLITTHAIHLHEDRRREPEWADFLERMEVRRQELSVDCAVDDALVAADYRWLALADTLSLVICNRWIKGFRSAGYSAQLEAETLLLEPFPLAGATTFRVACRWIPRRRYSSDTDLGVELASARWESATVRLAPR
jgi:hypothetical protein